MCGAVLVVLWRSALSHSICDPLNYVYDATYPTGLFLNWTSQTSGASGRIEPRRVLRCSQPLLEALVCIGEPPLCDAERVDQLGCLARAA